MVELRLALNYVAEASLELLILLLQPLRYYSYTKPGLFIFFLEAFRHPFFLKLRHRQLDPLFQAWQS